MSSSVRVTVCELSNDNQVRASQWTALVEHTRRSAPDIVLLPELPFSSWCMLEKPTGDAHRDSEWRRIQAEHSEFISHHISELSPATVLATLPVFDKSNGQRWNVGFAHVPSETNSIVHIHKKCYLPEEEGTYEQSYYCAADPNGGFEVARVAIPGGRHVTVGFLICSEVWAMQHAQRYSTQGCQLVLSPRATEAASVETWIAGGKSNAFIAGAYSLSSNRSGTVHFGGGGWIIDPRGQLLATTTNDTPFATVDIDLAAADRCKSQYPGYMWH